MKKIRFGLFILIITILAGCDLGHKHEEGHDHGSTEKNQPIKTDSGHEDAFGEPNAAEEESPPTGEIVFSEEQQQLVDFSTIEATNRLMHTSLQATGVTQASSKGQAIVTAPVSGYLATQETSFPHFGDKVTRGKIIARIVPSLNGGADPSSLEFEVQRTRSSHQLASEELLRVETLFNQGVVPEKRIQEARKEEQVAKADLISAEQRLKQYQSRPEKNDGVNAFEVTSPINGILDGVYVTPGAYLKEGDALFHVVNTDILRLEVRIPEADVARLINPQGAWFIIDGFDAPFRIDLSKEDRLIAVGNVIDPQSRTIPLVFEFANTNSALRMGMFARVHVIIGEPRETIAIPASAVQEYNGLTVVYVQSDKDSFERRVVNLGIRDGDFIEVEKGVELRERVVTKGSYLVQLAASGVQEAGHGHAH